MTTDNGLWIFALPLPQLLLKGIELRIGKDMTSNQANTKADLIVTLHVGALPVIRPGSFYHPTTVDNPVIPHPVPTKTQMHLMDLPRTDRLVIRGVRTMDNQMTNR